MKLVAYLRNFLMALLYLPFLLTISSFCFLQNLVFKNKKYDDFVVQMWARMSLAMFGVQVHVHGLENIPSGKGAVFIFNHSSFFDIFALGAKIPQLRFGAKIELFKIPLFGFAMKRVGMLPINRARRETVFKVYEDARHRILQGERFALAPEGGRSTDKTLLPFKSGPFVFAIQSQAWLVPVVISGADQILPKGEFVPNKFRWKTHIDLHILPALDGAAFEIEKRQELQRLAYEVMRQTYEQVRI